MEIHFRIPDPAPRTTIQYVLAPDGDYLCQVSTEGKEKADIYSLEEILGIVKNNRSKLKSAFDGFPGLSFDVIAEISRRRMDIGIKTMELEGLTPLPSASSVIYLDTAYRFAPPAPFPKASYYWLPEMHFQYDGYPAGRASQWVLVIPPTKAMIGSASWNDTLGIQSLAGQAKSLELCRQILALQDPEAARKLVEEIESYNMPSSFD